MSDIQDIRSDFKASLAGERTRPRSSEAKKENATESRVIFYEELKKRTAELPET